MRFRRDWKMKINYKVFNKIIKYVNKKIKFCQRKMNYRIITYKFKI